MELILTPRYLATDPVVSLACGANHTVAVTRKGKVISFGDNMSMQCGHDISTESVKLDNSDMSSGSPEKIFHFAKKHVRHFLFSKTRGPY